MVEVAQEAGLDDVLRARLLITRSVASNTASDNARPPVALVGRGTPLLRAGEEVVTLPALVVVVAVARSRARGDI